MSVIGDAVMLEFMFDQGEEIERQLQEYDLQEELEDLIVAIYGLTKTMFNDELFNQVVKVLKNNCDYSMMNTNLACLYASLLIVSFDNPTTKIFDLIETIEMVRTAGFRSRVSNMIGFILLDKEDIENQLVKALKIYHIMHDYHGIITGEDDYLSTVYLAGIKQSSKAIVSQIELDYKRLSSLSFKRGNALQSLVHGIQLLKTRDREEIITDIDELHLGLKRAKIKINGSQILILSLVAGLGLDVNDYVDNLMKSMDEQLEKKGLKRLRSLHKTSIMLQLTRHMYEEDLTGEYPDDSIDFIKATIMLILTAYLYREKLI
jgi:hypothetical protein